MAIFAIDFGYTNDPTAFLAAVADKSSRKIHIFDEFQEKGLLNNEIAKKIKFMGYGKEVIIADSAEPKSIEELRQNGLDRVKGVRKGKDSVLNGIQYLQQFEIIVHPRCKYISEELSNYTWQKDRNGFYINKPIETYNHCLTGDTIVNTLDGDISIEELVGKSGRVHCYDEINKKPTQSTFKNANCTKRNADIFEVKFEDGRTIKATAEHPMLTDKGWKLLKDLNVNDYIVDISECI